IFAAALLQATPPIIAAENQSPAQEIIPQEHREGGDENDRSEIRLDAPEPHSRFYGGLEYLYWWLKPAPLSVPLVSTGPISTTHHGWLINSDATILYGASHSPANGGNDSQAFSPTSGARLTLG